MTYAYIDTVGPDGRLSGYGSYRGFGAFGAGEGDVLGTGCLCGGPGVCTTAKLQGPAMAALRAAMRAAGLPTSAGNWTAGEQNAMNALARANGQATSSKFLVDGGPCVALKNLLAAPPAPVVVAPPSTPITDCASLLANAPPVPAGTPVATVLAVLQSIAGPGFDVSKCMGGAAPPTPTPTPQDTLPPIGVPVTTPSQSMLPYVLGGVGLLALGGVAFVAMRRSSGGSGMRKNGARRKGARVDTSKAQALIVDRVNVVPGYSDTGWGNAVVCITGEDGSEVFTYVLEGGGYDDFSSGSFKSSTVRPAALHALQSGLRFQSKAGALRAAEADYVRRRKPLW
jgi:hypothetical protein